MSNTGPRWADDPDSAPAEPAAAPAQPTNVPISGGKVEDEFFSYDNDPSQGRRSRAAAKAGSSDGRGTADLVQRLATAPC